MRTKQKGIGKNKHSVLSPKHSSLSASSSVLSTQSLSVSPLELLNLYFSDGQYLGNRENKLWRKMNELLTWDNILNRNYQSDQLSIRFGMSINRLDPIQRFYFP